jgi:hypothetical protein
MTSDKPIALIGLCLILLLGPLFLPVSPKTYLATTPLTAYILWDVTRRKGAP